MERRPQPCILRESGMPTALRATCPLLPLSFDAATQPSSSSNDHLRTATQADRDHGADLPPAIRVPIAKLSPKCIEGSLLGTQSP